MNAADPACVGCGAALEADQEYCLECGARQTPAFRPRWRRAVTAAAVTFVLAGLVLAFGYLRLRDDAEDDSSGASREAVKRAAASAPAGASDSSRPAPGALLVAHPSR
jgi:predicted amidophosphoribosyltransferase